MNKFENVDIFASLGHVKGKKRSLSSMFEAVGSYAAGTMTEEDVLEFEEKHTSLFITKQKLHFYDIESCLLSCLVKQIQL